STHGRHDHHLAHPGLPERRSSPPAARRRPRAVPRSRSSSRDREIASPDEAGRRGFHGSPALLVDGMDPFAGAETPPAFACRTYRTETGVEGAPSVDQIVTALTAGVET
ncbi:MAG: hypothetical protein ACYDDZ_11810, partial [Acidimicrobiales bacterium]